MDKGSKVKGDPKTRSLAPYVEFYFSSLSSWLSLSSYLQSRSNIHLFLVPSEIGTHTLATCSTVRLMADISDHSSVDLHLPLPREPVEDHRPVLGQIFVPSIKLSAKKQCAHVVTLVDQNGVNRISKQEREE